MISDQITKKKAIKMRDQKVKSETRSKFKHFYDFNNTTTYPSILFCLSDNQFFVTNPKIVSQIYYQTKFSNQQQRDQQLKSINFFMCAVLSRTFHHQRTKVQEIPEK